MLLLIPGGTKRSEAGPREAEIKSKAWADALRACELGRIRVLDLMADQSLCTTRPQKIEGASAVKLLRPL